MATIPPPYTTRDQVRAQVRAQRDAYRAQRDYWRAQRRPSVVRPLILIAIGLLALLIETGKLSGVVFWDWYVRWWPLLLIGLGILSLAEWWVDRDKPYGGRSIGGGIIFLLIMLAILGSISHGVTHSHGWQWFQSQTGDDDMGWHMFGQEHDADVSLDQKVPANAAVRIKDPHGDVTVAPSTDGFVHVAAHDVVYASTDKEGEKQLGRLAPKMTVNGTDVLVEAPDETAAHVDLTIEMPANASLDVYAGHGDISVNGTKATVKVTSGHGDVKLDELAGPVFAHMSKGDFSARDISGNVNVDGRMDDVTLTGIKSNVSLNGDFFGDMHLEKLAAPLYLHSSRTEITIASVPGNLSLTKGDVELNRVTGPIRLVTHGDDVNGNDVRGPLHLENSDGDVSITALAPLGEIDIHNDNGAIDLTLPAKTGFNLNASTSNGELSTDFDLSTNSNDDRRSASGVVGGGGPRVSVIADHGDVHIKKAGSVAASNDDTEAPEQQERHEAPEAPSKPVRHLHASSTDQPKPSVQ
jgi:DUF4097 and DUF4098 domain-containing protein YvlB